MRKAAFGICLLLCLSLLPACGAKQDAATGVWSVRQIAGALLDSQKGAVELYSVEPGDAFYELCLRDNYGLLTAKVVDGVILVSGGVSAQELAVLRFATEADARAGKAALEDYIDRREADYVGYFPEEADMIAASHAFVSGSTAALAICTNPNAAYLAFQNCMRTDPPLTERSFPRYADAAATPSPSPSPSSSPSPSAEPKPEPDGPPAEWVYSEETILQAWRSGGSLKDLSEKDAAIFTAVRSVLQLTVDEGMSDWEKALAVHDWMVYNADYDTNILTQLPNYEEDPDNDNPYGFLVHRKGICKGYTSTFQLFMDILGVECISVEGEADGAGEGWEEHAWNMIRLDGDWYVVDCTWDDPLSYGVVSDALHHRYFCATSDFIRRHNHRWDEDSVPEATATKYAWTG